MATHNESLVARYNNFITRMFRLTGDAGAKQISSDIQAVFQVVPPGPEDYILRDERLCAGGQVMTALAANFAIVKLVNPLNSGVLCVVESVRVINGNGLADTSNIYFSQILAQTVTGLSCFRDTRLLVPTVLRVPVCVIGGTNNVSLGALSGNAFLSFESIAGGSGTTPLQFNEGIIIQPGFALCVAMTALNTATTANFRWRERELPSEQILK